MTTLEDRVAAFIAALGPDIKALTGRGNVLLLAQGASVPGGTPAGTILFRKWTDFNAPYLALSPAVLLTLDETTGNFLDVSGNARHFTPGTGVVRGLSPLIPDGGKAASGDGTHEIAALASAGGMSTAITLTCVLDIPKGNVLGEPIAVGVPGSNGVSLAIANGAGFSAGRVLTGLSAGLGYANSGYVLPNVARKWRLGMTVTGTEWTFYVNGVYVGQYTAIGYTNPGAQMYIGRGLPSTWKMDQAAYFSTALSADDMESLLMSANPASYCPIGWWDGTKIQPLGRA